MVGALVEELRPRALILENVPGLDHDPRSSRLRALLRSRRYGVKSWVFDATQFCVPQRRKRFALIAVLGLSDEEIGDPRPDYQCSDWPPHPHTVRDVLGSLAPPNDGDALHVARDLPPDILERVQSIPHDGGSRRELPESLQLEWAREVPEIHDHLKKNYWLIDPRWQLIDDEVELTKLLEATFGINKALGNGMRLDFVYCLAPRFPALRDVVFLVEIKRGTLQDGTPRRVTSDELHRFHDYYAYLGTHLRKVDTYSPSLKGIMIAADYQQQALPVKKSYEENVGLEFKSWDSVLDGTERLHVGWLELSSARVQAGTDLVDA
jgi:site-specific DNA-cytosine methylase